MGHMVTDKAMVMGSRMVMGRGLSMIEGTVLALKEEQQQPERRHLGMLRRVMDRVLLRRRGCRLLLLRRRSGILTSSGRGRREKMQAAVIRR